VLKERRDAVYVVTEPLVITNRIRINALRWPRESTGRQSVSTETICSALAAAAAQNDLSSDFFARLIWQESRFYRAICKPSGGAGRRAVHAWCREPALLSNPFDPLEAIAESAKLLRDLRREFGHLGLAVAADNGGSRRVRDWRRSLGPVRFTPESGPAPRRATEASASDVGSVVTVEPWRRVRPWQVGRILNESIWRVEPHSSSRRRHADRRIISPR
jgi:hypothetical protein